MSAVVNAVGKQVNDIDERLTIANFVKRNTRKVFPDHWTFMFGEMALYSFIVLLLSGVYLTLFFRPSMVEVIYNGSYTPLKGVSMSEAYESTLFISFDIRGGLLLRQIHHWAAMIFMAAMSIHVLRVFFTGAFRKPRELNWSIGVLLLTMGMVEGFAGYSLPDDLLSGTGLRIAEGIILSIPIVGTYLQFFIFGGEFPGSEFISRLYGVHILLVPGIILALITVHLMIVWYQKHTQYPGAGRTNDNVVGYPVLPVYTAKAGGFFFAVFGVIILISGLVTINPIWLYGPYTPDQITAGSQPDWYMGWLEGALRIMPNIETVLWNHWTISWNVFIPALCVMGAVMTSMALYPWIEAWATGDKGYHNLLDRPRNAPVRTGLGVMALTFYILLWIAGGNDVIGRYFDLSINSITWFMRFAVVILPPIAFVVTKRACLGLQRRDHEKLLHGRETGTIQRMPTGEFLEVHAPLNPDERAKILSKPDIEPLPEPPAQDENGVKLPHARKARTRARLSRWFFGANIAKPSAAELAAADAHIAHDAEESAALVAHHEQLESVGAVLRDPSGEGAGHD